MESIAGPFANSIPARICVDEHMTLRDFVRRLSSHLLELSRFQFTPLMDIQRCSEIPWQQRLFDSLVVFQNYTIDDSARRFGSSYRNHRFLRTDPHQLSRSRYSRSRDRRFD